MRRHANVLSAIALCAGPLGCMGEALPLGGSGSPGVNPGGSPGGGPSIPGGGGNPGGGNPGGSVGTPSNPTTTPGQTGVFAPTSFTCNPGAATPSTAWRKLGATQYRNTLSDLLAFALRDGAAANAVLGQATALARLPADERQRLPMDLHGSYRRLDQSVEQLQVEITYEVALAVAAGLTTPAARLGTVVGACATDGNPANDADCLNGFIQRFGERALRRPLAADEVTFYRSLYGGTPGSDPLGYADVIAGLLTAPQFLYHVEHGEAAVAGRDALFGLTGYELASRLSYHFWDTMPDEALWTAARSGALKTAEGFRREVDRLFNDPRARAPIDAFLRDWLKLEDVADMDTRREHPVFRAFAGPDLPTASLRNDMIEDVLALARHYTWDSAGTFDDLLSSELSFTRSAALARIYGLGAWSGSGAPPSFPAGQRPGLFTRAAFLATGSPGTRPVMKGVFLRSNILCDAIPAPPDNAAANSIELSPMLSTRQVVENLTEASGTACASCHRNLINPLGFATENFDALGRVRTAQPLYNDAGAEVGRAPVDTRTVPRVHSEDDSPVEGAGDLMRLIADSGKAQACFARHYFRFSFSRWEDLNADGCVLERLRQVLARKAPLSEVLREVALSPEFQQRTIR